MSLNTYRDMSLSTYRDMSLNTFRDMSLNNDLDTKETCLFILLRVLTSLIGELSYESSLNPILDTKVNSHMRNLFTEKRAFTVLYSNVLH